MGTLMTSQSLADIGAINPRLSQLLYGIPGSGKTIFAHSFPGSTRTLDFDGGMQSVLWAIKEGIIKKDPNEIIFRSFADPNDPKKGDKVFDLATDQVDEWMQEEEDDPSKAFNTIIVDSGTMLTDHSIIKGLSENARLGTSKSWSQFVKGGIVPMKMQDFGSSAQLFKHFMKMLLATEKNVILICHEYAEVSDAGNTVGLHPKLIGQLRQDIPMLMDEVYYMGIKGSKDKVEYTVQTKRDGLRQCKSRLGCFDAIEKCNFGAMRQKVADFYGVPLESVWNPSAQTTSSSKES